MYSETDSHEDALDDATTEEGDEHTRQITGGSRASMLSPENPKSQGHINYIS